MQRWGLLWILPTFLGVTGQAIVTDGAHDMGLFAVFVVGTAHGFTVNGQAFVVLCMLSIPLVESLIQHVGTQTYQDMANS